MLIKEIRTKKGYTQEALARLLNISLRHYQNIETYKSCPSVTLALKLCDKLNIEPKEIWIP
jgi:putative transcriptional regulator